MSERRLVYFNPHWWMVTNWGMPHAVYSTRKQCIHHAEECSGKPWKECRKYFEVRRVTVTPSPQEPAP